jgi:hypothetical protein
MLVHASTFYPRPGLLHVIPCNSAELAPVLSDHPSRVCRHNLSLLPDLTLRRSFIAKLSGLFPRLPDVLSKWEFSALLSTIVEIFDLKLSYQTTLRERHPTFDFTTDLKELRCSDSDPNSTTSQNAVYWHLPFDFGSLSGIVIPSSPPHACSV